MKEQLKKLDDRMYNLNRKLSALVHIQKLKTKQEAEQYLMLINKEIADWIKEVRYLHEHYENEHNKGEEE